MEERQEEEKFLTNDGSVIAFALYIYNPQQI